MHKAKRLFTSLLLLLCFTSFGQTLIINEFSNGPSGSQEYIELVVVDTSSGVSSCAACIDIRGWIIDDNNGFHGSFGVASGCNRFSNDVFWSCIPVGTSITIYNGNDPNIDLPPNDLEISDGNCNLVIPIEDNTLFETNPNTPGAVFCDYPNLEWNPGGIWSRIGMRNAGDCIRLVDLTGCEVFSLSYGDISLNSTIYFPGSGTDDVFYFSGMNPYLQSDWNQGCAGDAGACVGNDQSPGTTNSNLNNDYIAQYQLNGCEPVTPISLLITNQSSSCGNCTGSITLDAIQGQGPYLYSINPPLNINSNPSSSPATLSNICSGQYVATVIDENGCTDSLYFEIESDELPIINTISNVNVCNGSSLELNAILEGSANTISWVSLDGYFSDSNSLTTTFTPSINSTIASVVVTAESENCGNVQENIFVNVTPPVDPIFSQLATQCEGAIFSLNTTSLNGIEGYWSPEINNETTTTYSFTPAPNQCANSQSMTIIIIPSIDTVLNQTICPSELPFEWNGLIFNEPGSQTYTLESISGCDSLVTLNLSLNTLLNSNTDVTICDSELPYVWNGLSVESPGTYTTSLISLVTGCDSLVSLTLSVNPILSSSESITICDNQLPYVWNGFIFNNASTETVSLTSLVTGCDSLATLTLSLNSTLFSISDTVLCDYDLPFEWNGLTYTESGSQTYNLSSVFGCDSVATLNVEVVDLAVPEIISSSPVTCPTDIVDLSVLDIPGAQFYWEGPMNFASLESSNSFELDYDNSGAYSVYYILNGCVSETSTEELGLQSEFDWNNFDFPNVITANGDGVNDEIDINHYIGECEDFELIVFNRWGNEVHMQKSGDDAFDGKLIFNDLMPEGIYFYKFTHSQGFSSGFIHLIR